MITGPGKCRKKKIFTIRVTNRGLLHSYQMKARLTALLIQKKKDMDVVTFKETFLPMNRLMYAEALRLLRDSADAEDAVQDTYANLWERREKLDGIDNRRAYAMAMLRNRCLTLVTAQPDDAASFDESGTSTDTAPPPSDGVEARDRLRRALEIIDGLPENQRRVIVLHDIEEQSNEEIQTQTGLSPDNIRQLLSRARKAIRSRFSK